MPFQWNSDPYKRLDKAKEAIESVKQFGDLFPPQFMSCHTKFATIEDMLSASNLFPDDTPTEERMRALETEEWSKFVAENSEFGAWQEMRQAAIHERMQKAINS